MNILDIAKGLVPECEIEYIGARPGEKLHEVLLSEDEAHRTVELDDMYIIKPAHPWWLTENWTSAKLLPEGFLYASDRNTRWLSMDELQKLVELL